MANRAGTNVCAGGIVRFGQFKCVDEAGAKSVGHELQFGVRK